MKRTKRSLAITWLTCSALILSLCSGILITENAGAAAKSDERPHGQRKVADDLQQQLNNSDETVQVILQLNGAVSKELAALLKSNGIKIKKHFSNFNSFAVELPAGVIEQLAMFPEVSFVSSDSPIQILGHLSSTTGADDVRQQSNASGGSYTLDGSGIGIAVLDSGIFASHKSFADAAGRSRVVYSQDFTGQNRVDDPFGHGTFVAGIAAGSSSIYRSDYTGVASNAKIINLRVLDSLGKGSISGVLAALDWVMANRLTYNVKVVNLSLGAPAVSTYTSDPLCKAVRRLVDAGLVVVTAAGNDGKDANGQKLYGAIHSPGNEPSAITVGATNTFGTNSRGDDQVASYSSSGPTRSYRTDAAGLKHYDNFIKPDLVAPGNKLIAAEAVNNYLVTQNPSLETGLGSHKPNEQMMYLSGTSGAAPAVAGAAALLLQANPQLTPNMVKMILMYTAQQLSGFNTLQQGAGALNMEGAIRLAKLVRTNLPATPALGTQLLTTSTGPVSQSTIDGTTFQWAQGIIMDQTFARGSDLITKYQKIYARGVLLSDGTLFNNGVLLSDSTMMSSGVLLSDNILTSSGVLLGDGYIFLSCGVLLGDGVLLSDGVLLGDGRVISDGVLLADGVLMGDGVLLGDVRAKAWQVMVNGD